ncbi:MAG: hypothetical protein HC813_02030 [Planctomycetes bacterium]|nr:hypothetical protein [Planctomycetota bacterium]
MARFSDESQQDGERRIARYVLRLGNSRYPHMKLVLEESILRGEFAFGVDTHDDLNVSPNAPDFDRWNVVRTHNRSVAEGSSALRAPESPPWRTSAGLIGPVRPPRPRTPFRPRRG